MCFKVLIFLMCFAAFAKQESLKQTNPKLFEKIETHTDECLAESKANEADVVKMLDESEFLENQEIKCFLKCILTKANVFNEQGVVQNEGFKNLIPSDSDRSKIANALRECQNTKAEEENQCETAFKITKCIFENFQ